MIGPWETDENERVPPYLIYLERLGEGVLTGPERYAPDALPNHSVLRSETVNSEMEALLPDEGDELTDANTEALNALCNTELENGSDDQLDASYPKRFARLKETVRNTRYHPNAPIDVRKLLKAKPWTIAKDAVFTVVIDTGISPGHARFHSADGGSRVLAAWQQNGNAEPHDASLPFGRELMRADLNDDVRRLRAGDWSDEQMLRHQGLIGGPDDPEGIGMMAHSSHGMHTADLAAGYDLDDAVDAAKQPLIFVNLPPRRAIGRSGAYLPAFVVPALSRALLWIDTLWDIMKHRYKRQCETGQDPQQWPIVVNISFGQNAGPKDGHEHMERMISHLLEDRAKLGRRRPDIVMPVGNSNLQQSHVRAALNINEEKVFQLRVQPEDQTPSVIEFWTEPLESADWPVRVRVTEPGGVVQMVQVPLQRSSLAFLSARGGKLGMVFARQHKRNDGKIRFQIKVILNPTQYPSTVPNGTALTLPGVWEIAFGNLTGQALRLHGDVEIDQALKAGSQTQRRAYFIDPDFAAETDDAGRPYDLGELRQQNIDNLRADVKQTGGQNSLANASWAQVVAGHRASDGVPAPYSSAMLGRSEMGQPRQISSSRPSDDAPAHLGVLAAGISSSATNWRQGTSFAAALETRALVEGYLGNAPRNLGYETSIRLHWCSRPTLRNSVPVEKIGPERKDEHSIRRRVSRLASGFPLP